MFEFELYKDAFGASVDNMMTFGEVKMGTEIVSGNQTSFTIVMNNPETVKAAFEKIKVGGKVMIEPAPTFFSPCHFGLVDRFGVMWQINCQK